MKIKYVVDEELFDSINQLLKIKFNISARLLSKLIKNKKVMLNEKPCDTRKKPLKNDIIIVDLEYEEDNNNIIPLKMDLDIVYEDEGVLAINKKASIPTHPSLKHYQNSLSNGVKYYFDIIGLKKKIRPVNRLDLNTSGLVIFAKNEYIQESLIKQMNKGLFKKTYLCIACGILKEKRGTINLPIARKEESIIERCIREDGQKSITHYKVIKEINNNSVVECDLETGRTHQIRVHFAYLGHPLLGDSLYGKESDLIKRQALHCQKIQFINPVTNEKITLKSDLPMDMKSVII